MISLAWVVLAFCLGVAFGFMVTPGRSGGDDGDLPPEILEEDDGSAEDTEDEEDNEGVDDEEGFVV